MDRFQCGNRALDCVQRHISVMSIRYNRGFHQRIGKAMPGVGYLTGLRMALKGDHPSRVRDPNSVTEIISRGRRKHLCRILQAFTHEKFWIRGVTPQSKRRSFWRTAPWAERLSRAERPPASTRRSNC